MNSNPFNFKGLTEAEVIISREKNGRNSIEDQKSGYFWFILKEIVLEPMFLLLLATSTIYFVLREFSEGLFLLGAIIIISAISFFQNARSRKALDALKEYTQTLTTVIRNNQSVEIRSEEIVVGDIVVAQEGELITADGIVLQLNDFSVNESILTGEAFSVNKSTIETEDNTVFRGTAVVSGQCVFRVTQVGRNTKLGKIDTSLAAIEKLKSPLQDQISRFVKQMALWGFVIFLIIWGISFYTSNNLLDSLLKGLTIAMSVLPEEIPVAFATFMALGAYRLMKLGIIVKQTQTIETLGAATILCTDKTGTITQNKMKLFKIYSFKTKSIGEKNNWNSPEFIHIISTAMWASESVPFNPMEKALHKIYEKVVKNDERPNYKMIHEYPLAGKPPMMTHIFANEDGNRVIAVKGAPEAIIKHSNLTSEEKKEVQKTVAQLAADGLRVLGVGESKFEGENFPENQEEFKFKFLGLLGF